MSERKAKAARRATQAEVEAPGANGTGPEANGVGPESSGAAEGPGSMHLAHPAVVVVRVPLGDQPGHEDIQIMELNGIDRLSIPTLLRKAAAIMEQNLGL